MSFEKAITLRIGYALKKTLHQFFRCFPDDMVVLSCIEMDLVNRIFPAGENDRNVTSERISGLEIYATT